MIKKLTTIIILCLAIFVVVPNSAIAQQLTVSSAKSQNLVIEQSNGMLGAVSTSAEVKNFVKKTNAARLKKYQEVAKANGLSVEQVQKLAGAKLMGKQ